MTAIAASPPPPARPRRLRYHHDPSRVPRRYSLEMVRHGEEALLALARYGFLTNVQVAALFFVDEVLPDGHRRSARAARVACNTSLLRLKDREWVARLMVYHRHPATGHRYRDAVHVLTHRGARLAQELSDRRGAGERVRWRAGIGRYADQVVDHELGIRDAAIALEVACRHQGWSVGHWHDDAALDRERRRGTILLQDFIPDGFCLVGVGNRRCPLFLEIDRGGENVQARTGNTRDWQTKIERYGRYFKERYPTDPFFAGLGLEPRAMEKPVVLTVTESEARVGSMLAATRAAGGRGTYWYTTKAQLNEARGAVLEGIWRVASSRAPRRLADHLAGRPSPTTPSTIPDQA